ncbi:hypothetical protein BS78_09G029200 [Paspalum vaginatum]|nr:hypothetical protein BS78_09G029200 [Paspalum vaginatum]
MGNTPQASAVGLDSSMGPYTSPSWSDLPTDMLLSILQRLELPQALVFAAVCTSWRQAAIVAGIPSFGTPWLMSWRDLLEEREDQVKSSSPVTCKFRNLLDVDKVYDVTFPRSSFVCCCGASHGWLILVNELCNLVLYNLFTLAIVPLPPVTDFTYVEAVYDGERKMEGYLYDEHRVYKAKNLAPSFYQKAVLSCSPSKRGKCIAVTIHQGGSCLSFARAGEGKWQVVSTLDGSNQGRYADCAFHNGKLYTVTLQGVVEKWDLGGLNGPTKEVIVDKRRNAPILTRHLVSTPWGDLLQASAVLEIGCRRLAESVRFQICNVDSTSKMGPQERARAVLQHAMFIGLNHSACLSPKNFSGLKPGRIYFSVPWMTDTKHFLLRCHSWKGVKIYNLKKKIVKDAFPPSAHRYAGYPLPSEVWITPCI